jgi:hypothetical protein
MKLKFKGQCFGSNEDIQKGTGCDEDADVK